MPRPRFQRAAPEKRDAILDAASAEFGANGYDGASVNRILLAAGFSKGAFYYYFDDKADLAAAVLEREAGRWIADLEKLALPGTAAEFWQVIDSFLELTLAELSRPSGHADTLTRLGTAMGAHPELMEQLGPMIGEATARLSALWRRGQEVGAVRTDLPLPTLMTLMQNAKVTLMGALLPADRAATREEIERFSRVHFDLVRRISERRAPAEGAHTGGAP